MDNIRQLQSERNKLQHLAHKSNSVNLWSKLREERNNLRTKSKQVKQLFYQRALSSSKPKELWQVIHHMLHPQDVLNLPVGWLPTLERTELQLLKCAHRAIQTDTYKYLFV